VSARTRSLRVSYVGFVLSATSIATLAACESATTASDGTQRYDGGNGDAIDDAGGAPAHDAANDSDAGTLTPAPSYDFRVTCASEPCVVNIGARGGSHACATLSDGTARCWGANASGQLGRGVSGAGPTPILDGTPRAVVGITNAKSVVASGRGTSGSTCVITDGGELSCFGSDAFGQLGRGENVSNEPYPEPVVVDGLRAKWVTITNTFVLAADVDDQLWSWGTNDVGQLARTTTGADGGIATAPGRASGVANAVRAAAGTSKTGFAVALDGVLRSWGGGVSDQLGRATSLSTDPVPAAVAVPGVTSVATGDAHACALAGAEIYCWGSNAEGQLGTGRKLDEISPARVLMPADVVPVAVFAGGSDTCAIVANGDLYCWGASSAGQLGTISGLAQAQPNRIEGLAEETVGVAIMDEAMCALSRSGVVACWGDNLFGQLGRGARDLELHPQPSPITIE